SSRHEDRGHAAPFLGRRRTQPRGWLRGSRLDLRLPRGQRPTSGNAAQNLQRVRKRRWTTATHDKPPSTPSATARISCQSFIGVLLSGLQKGRKMRGQKIGFGAVLGARLGRLLPHYPWGGQRTAYITESVRPPSGGA